MDKDIGLCSITEDICRKEGECEKCSLKHIHENIEHYAKLHEQGRLIELPYDMGNCEYIYYADEEDSEVYVLNADEIHISKMPTTNRILFTIDGFEFFLEDFGKIVFLTKEEAKARLRELNTHERE